MAPPTGLAWTRPAAGARRRAAARSTSVLSSLNLVFISLASKALLPGEALIPDSTVRNRSLSNLPDCRLSGLDHGPSKGIRPRARPAKGDESLLASWLREHLGRGLDAGDGNCQAEPLRHLRRQARLVPEGPRVLPGSDERRHATDATEHPLRQGGVRQASLRPGRRDPRAARAGLPAAQCQPPARSEGRGRQWPST